MINLQHSRLTGATELSSGKMIHPHFSTISRLSWPCLADTHGQHNAGGFAKERLGQLLTLLSFCHPSNSSELYLWGQTIEQIKQRRKTKASLIKGLFSRKAWYLQASHFWVRFKLHITFMCFAWLLHFDQLKWFPFSLSSLLARG